MRKKSQKGRLSVVRVGWTAGCVSSTGEAMSVGGFLIPTHRGVGGFLQKSLALVHVQPYVKAMFLLPFMDAYARA